VGWRSFDERRSCYELCSICDLCVVDKCGYSMRTVFYKRDDTPVYR
jgi:hypothetical protein